MPSPQEEKIIVILQAAIKHAVSDIHFASGLPPAFRNRDGVVNINVPAFTDEDMASLCQLFITDTEVKNHITTLQDFDGSYEISGLARFRFNIFRNKTKLAAVLRVIPNKVPSIEDLKLPPVLKKIAETSRGLILVTGATGSGKSSTLAAMIDHINNTQLCHVLTIEDPIEFIHSQKKSRISQREVGRDTKNFAMALRSALRQDPDVILVGEMRDVETLDIALKAAETGHLVFSTVHTTDAIKTIGRLIAMYPADEQHAVRLRLSENLHSTVSQRLVNGIQPGSRIVVQEIMITNLGIKDCIANDKRTHEMNMFIEKAHEVIGSQTFDQHLAVLVHQKMINMDIALEASTNPSDFQRNFSFSEASGASGTEDGGSSLTLQEEESKPAPSPEPAKNPSANPGLHAPKATVNSSPHPVVIPPSIPKTVTKTATPVPAMPNIPKPPKAA